MSCCFPDNDGPTKVDVVFNPSNQSTGSGAELSPLAIALIAAAAGALLRGSR